MDKDNVGQEPEETVEPQRREAELADDLELSDTQVDEVKGGEEV
jgi:hypothetical protein